MRTVVRAGAIMLAATGLAIGVMAAARAQSSAGARPPARPRYKTTAPAGTRNENLLMAGWTDPRSGFNVRQNMWNCPDDCGAQTLWANSSSDWGVVSDQPKGNTAVLVYPDVQNVLTLPDGNPAPLRAFTAINSAFRQSMPSSGDFEAAFDIWLNNWNTEVMIWTDNHGQQPAGSVVATTNAIYGQKWTLWDSPGSSGGYPSGPLSFVLRGNETSGTVHVLPFLKYLIQHKYIPGNSAIDDVEYGWEICSTNGKAEDFFMKSYSLTVRMLPGPGVSPLPPGTGRGAAWHQITTGGNTCRTPESWE